ncbi:MAG: 3-dehydroquinate synthase [Pseudomonadota bacterium]
MEQRTDSFSDAVAAETRWQRFAVSYDFPVVFTEECFSPDNRALLEVLGRLEPDKRHKCLFFVDSGVLEAKPELLGAINHYAHAHGAAIELAAAPIVVPGGEAIKQNLHFVERMQRALFEHHIDRHSYAVGIGGGAFLDALGLVAATTHRGVRHVRMPTTVLAQNDSGVGVKNGVNLFEQKNFVGTFAPPFGVINDLAFVESLGQRDKIAGMAEAVKVALIRDGEFFTWLERNADRLATFERDAMAYMIRRCAELHMRQIGRGGDPFETGSARPLDYGHWSAHRLETMTNHHLRHGEAVAIGIALDARYSVRAGLLEPGAEDRICFLLEHLGFKLWHPALEHETDDGKRLVLQGLTDFQEHLGGELTITLLESVGIGIEVHQMDYALIRECIDWLKLRNAV